MSRRRPQRGPASLPAASDLRGARFQAGAEGYVVVSLPLSPFLEPLSPAERETAAGLLRGLGNAEIAAARQVSVRTVANQVASILRKLQVGTRVEAIARLKLSEPITQDRPPQR